MKIHLFFTLHNFIFREILDR